MAILRGAIIRHPTRFGIKLTGQGTTVGELTAVWRLAEATGFDHLWVFDHLAPVVTDDLEVDVYEAWTLLSAMATTTSRIRLGCMVTGNTYRHPAVLAKMATTIDHLSDGRLEFGIGAAWSTVEHEMFGFEGLDHRVGRLDESLSVIKALWTAPGLTDFAGKYYRLKGATARPRPVQRPHPPVWLGAGGEMTIALAARYADVWCFPGSQPGDCVVAAARIDDACERIGRNPADLRRAYQITWDGADPDRLADTLFLMAENGFSEQIVIVPPGAAEAVTLKAAEAIRSLRVRG
jgi:probable F420-dependent oxidoreductase